MPDISMCKSSACPVRENCYRNSASGTEPNQYRQSYGGFVPDTEHGKGCDHHWPLTQISLGTGGQYRDFEVTEESR